jgi:hypothetical protein
MADSNYKYPFLEKGQWHIKMIEREAIRLARQQPPEEFGCRVQPKDIPSA